MATPARIEVGTVRSRLWPVPPEAKTALLERFVFPLRNAYFIRKACPWSDGRAHFFGADGYFLTGLLPAVADVLAEAGCEVAYEDARARPVRRPALRGARVEPREDYQRQVIATAWEAVVATVRAATNSGKTVIAIVLSELAGARALFLVPTVDLAAQTAARFRDAFPGAAVVQLSGDGALDDAAWAADVVVANVQALAHRCRAHVLKTNARLGRRTLRLGPLTPEGRRFLASFGTLFGDEVHLMSSDEWSKLARDCPAYYRWALSATPETGDRERDVRRQGYFGEIVGHIEQRFLAERGYSVRVTVRCLEYRRAAPLPGGAWAAQYRDGIVRCAERNGAFARAIGEEVAAGRRVMAIVEHYDHALELGRLLDAARTRWAFASGGNRARRPEMLKAFRAGRVPVLLATRVFNQGISVDEIDALAIVAGGAKESLTVQRAGRLVRVRPDKRTATLYDARDLGIYAPGVGADDRHLERHFRARVRAYRGEGFDVVGAEPERRPRR